MTDFLTFSDILTTFGPEIRLFYAETDQKGCHFLVSFLSFCGQNPFKTGLKSGHFSDILATFLTTFLRSQSKQTGFRHTSGQNLKKGCQKRVPEMGQKPVLSHFLDQPRKSVKITIFRDFVSKIGTYTHCGTTKASFDTSDRFHWL